MTQGEEPRRKRERERGGVKEYESTGPGPYGVELKKVQTSVAEHSENRFVEGFAKPFQSSRFPEHGTRIPSGSLSRTDACLSCPGFSYAPLRKARIHTVPIILWFGAWQPACLLGSLKRAYYTHWRLRLCSKSPGSQTPPKGAPSCATPRSRPPPALLEPGHPPTLTGLPRCSVATIPLATCSPRLGVEAHLNAS